MNENIFRLFKTNKVLLVELERIISGFREQNFDLALRRMALSFDYLNNLVDMLPSFEDYFLEIGIELDVTMFISIFKELLDAQERKDYILLADLCELRLAPVLYQLQGILLSGEEDIIEKGSYTENLEILEHMDPHLGKSLKAEPIPLDLIGEGYHLEPSSGGDMTLAVGNGLKKHYLHSNNNVWKEAALLARSWYAKDKSKYIIYGLGLGYHIYELHLLDTNLNIEVYESDIQIIRLACDNTDNIKLFRNPQLTLIYDPDFTRLANRIDGIEEDTEFVIHYPSLVSVNNNSVKEKLENYFIQLSAVKNQLPLLNGNFLRNIRNYDQVVDELSEEFQGRPLFIVAAGPSLDNNFLQLKEVGDKGIILATGTVFKKLLKAGIRPDYVLVTDPNDRVYKQISGYEDCDVPMLFLSTAFYGFAANYQGKKYVVCQKDYPKAEEFAKQRGLHLFQTGSSVSTTALDIGITFGCSRIIFLGLDLAYTDDYAHASGTSRRKAVELQDMRQVEDIHGNMVMTSRSLDIFRNWIENRIRDVKGIEFIDATEGGARIHGMRIAKLEEVLKEI